MNVADALQQRTSAHFFDPSATLSDAEITTLVELAQNAPSSMNVQFTRFVAVTDPALKARLKDAAYGQAKVEAASVVFVLVGDLEAAHAFAERTRAAAALGAMPVDVAERTATGALNSFGEPTRAREECVRSVGLSAMALMLAAQERGWVSCPMTGFQPAVFSEILGLSSRYVPLMLVVVGTSAPGNLGRKPRLGTDVVLRINRADL